jgi:nucleoside-diphosphate-sugar epimerase
MDPSHDILILGCGYTGQRVAQSFLAGGSRVMATTRHPEGLRHLREAGAEVLTIEEVPKQIRPGMLVLHSIPYVDPASGVDVVNMLETATNRGCAPHRVVYLGTTGVYGEHPLVDETTPTGTFRPFDAEKMQARLVEEQRVLKGSWVQAGGSSLVLRPAAIYGPGRGVHLSIQKGTYTPGENYISRIHVDDLATHAVAGLLSTVTGAYPVADELPCTTREIYEFCAQLLGLPMVSATTVGGPSGRISSNRRVDGSAIRRLLAIGLRYPTYREGIPAAIAVERRDVERAEAAQE